MRLWQRPRAGGQGNRVIELAIERVGAEVQIAGSEVDAVDLCVAAAAAQHHGRAGDGIAVAQIDGRRRLHQLNADDGLAR